MEEKKKRGRPRKSPEQKQQAQEAREVAKNVVETLKEVIKYVPEPRLQGFSLYHALAVKGFPQGGMGVYMEDPNGTERVYIPEYSEVISFFMADPEKMNQMRDAVIRAYIELA